jgi:protein disulfide isomerase family A protein 3
MGILLYLITTLIAIGPGHSANLERIVELSDTNFNEFIGKNPQALVFWYTTYSKNFQESLLEYDRVLTLIQKMETNTALAKVESTKSYKLAHSHGVEVYPTLQFFIKGAPVTYPGKLIATEILRWVRRAATSASIRLASWKVFVKHRKKIPGAVAVYVSCKKDESLDVWMRVAGKAQKVDFFHVINEKCDYENGSDKKIVVYGDRADLEGALFDSKFEPNRILGFVDQNKFPVIMNFDLDRTANDRVFLEKKTGIVLFTAEHTSSELKIYENFAKLHRGKLIFVKAHPSSGLGSRLAEFLKVLPNQTPCIRLLDPRGPIFKKYQYQGKKISLNGLRNFLSAFEEGTLASYYKSQRVKKNTKDGAVTVLTASLWKYFFRKRSKDVLVYFYVDWCKHCQKLGPVYQQLAERLGHMGKDLVLAKMDIIENEIDGLGVDGVPALRLYKRDGGVVDFDKYTKRSEEGLVKFLRKNVNFEWVDQVVETDL